MPKLTENVLIGGRVYLAGEEVSEVDAKGVRPEVFAPQDAPAADEPASESEGDADTTEDAPAADEPAKVSRARGKGSSSK